MREINEFFNTRKKYGIKLGFERINYLLKELDNPEQNLPAIHVAGTNGKGSTIHFIQKSLIANGYRVGVFTSPSFTGIGGHILINEKEISEESLLKTLNQLLPVIKKLDEMKNHPTEFEIITVLAFLYFRNNVDIALIETGMGGKEDTTNAIVPFLSIITNIEWDHIDYLGPTILDIAKHKAGIIKKDIPLIIGKLSNATKEIVLRIAAEKSSEIIDIEHDCTLIKHHDAYQIKLKNNQIVNVKLSMQGMHQYDNVMLALQALQILNDTYQFRINWETVTVAINEAQLPGRFEKVSTKPTVIIDSAHNEAGILAFLQTVKEIYPTDKKELLFAGFKDKQLEEMLLTLQTDIKKISFTTFAHNRAASTQDLPKSFLLNNEIAEVEDWQQYIRTIINCQDGESIYFITGSLHFVVVARNFIQSLLS